MKEIEDPCSWEIKVGSKVKTDELIGPVRRGVVQEIDYFSNTVTFADEHGQEFTMLKEFLRLGKN